jgi:hypothetical protein
MPLTTNENRIFEVYNTKWSEAARAAQADIDASVFAGPNLTFPVVDSQDLTLALNLVHYAPDPDRTQADIIRIANSRGLRVGSSARGVPVSNADPFSNATLDLSTQVSRGLRRFIKNGSPEGHSFDRDLQGRSRVTGGKGTRGEYSGGPDDDADLDGDDDQGDGDE